MPQSAVTQPDTPDRLRSAKETAVTRFLRTSRALPRLTALAASSHPDHNVVGVGIGAKITKGKRTPTSAIRLYVERKIAALAVPEEFLLPPSIGGVPTDVIETGRFRALPATTPMVRRRLRPARPGCSVGFQFTGSQAGFVMAGTCGAIVTATSVRYLLSNNHVLANENTLLAGSPIFQPGLLDEGDPERDQIARLSRFITLRKTRPNSVDCAIAEVLEPTAVRPTFLPKVGRLASPEPIDAVEGMRVHKVGRTTSYTRGRIFDVSADVRVEYDLGVLLFQDQLLILGEQKMFSDRGDSGAVIVDRATRRATALVFAGSASHTLANPLTNVLAQLGVSMVV